MNKVNGKTILVLVRITDLLVDFKVNKIQAETTKIKDFVVSDFDAFNKCIIIRNLIFLNLIITKRQY